VIKKILIIAGSDPSGGAGIQADIKTSSAHKTYACAAITCLTAQNTQKVFAVENPSIEFLRKQIEVVLDDIKIDAIKTGMLGNKAIITCVSEILKKKAKKIPLILDPVMVATSGDLLLEKDAIAALKELISQAKIVTPNIDEAEILAGIKIKNLADMMLAAAIIKDLGCEAVLIKGGHLNFSDGRIYSILLDENNQFHKISNKKIGNKNIHGTGCTLASALACNIANGLNLERSARKANLYVVNAIRKSLKVGKGSLILRHF
jgi:hydroxymethylpyrimidine/phosphomethylpyrimidine kinase